MSKVLLIKNKQLPLLIKVLRYDMPFARGRVRNRFLDLVNPYLETYSKNRLELCNEFCKKDADDKPIIENGRYIFEIDSKFYEEIETLLEEDARIDIPDSLKYDMHTIKAIVELSTVDLSPDEVAMLETIIDSFTAYNEFSDKKTKKG